MKFNCWEGQVGCVLLVVMTQLCTPLVQESFGQAQENKPTDEVGPRYFIYAEGPNDDYPFAGVMPDGQGVGQVTDCKENPHRGQFCYRGRYQIAKRPWVAVAAMLDGLFTPERKFNMFNRLEAKPGDRIVVRFWARSSDRARVQFKAGGGDGDSLEFAVATDWIELDPSWKRYEIDVTDQDLSGLRFAFVWAMDRAHNDVPARENRATATVYLDDIYFTRVQKNNK